MYLLDTNVISDLMQTEPTPELSFWFSMTDDRLIYFSAIGEAELRYGAEILPRGQRRDSLMLKIERTLNEAFEERILPFDSVAAKCFGSISAMRRNAGRPSSQPDCQMAAIAKSRELTMVTRNVREFSGVGISILNPWEPAGS